MGYLPVRDFNLRHTVECGQFFRWTRDGDGYLIQSRSRFFRCRQTGSRLHFEGEDAAFVSQFFSLDHDLAEIRREIDRDPHIREALDRYWGLRLIRQDPWECVASFLTSIASNIPRITRNIGDMSRHAGESVVRGSTKVWQFPRPERLDDEDLLRRLKLGFRAKYLVQAACLANAGMLEDMAGLDTDSARESLMIIPGVAEKVADCVLLFAYGHLGAFPVDTWIRKVMTRLYFRGKPTSDAAIREFAARRFGQYAGYAQQYLYVHSRENWKEIEARPIPTKSTTFRRRRVANAATPASVQELIDSLLSEPSVR